MRTYEFLVDRGNGASRVHLNYANDAEAIEAAWQIALHWPVRIFDGERPVADLPRLFRPTRQRSN
ncbi:MAG TPA: hypothetical protein VFS01_15790 [Rhizomicrobium sp.]|jgi:hypothetical protein|nr:hypothetical protein [Rhizomicrobium sp.]